jgi:hypothetical protein
VYPEQLERGRQQTLLREPAIILESLEWTEIHITHYSHWYRIITQSNSCLGNNLEEVLHRAPFLLGSALGLCLFQHLYLDGDEARRKTSNVAEHINLRGMANVKDPSEASLVFVYRLREREGL